MLIHADQPQQLNKSTTSTSMDLSHSYVGPEGAIRLAADLKSNSTLPHLNLRDTYIGTAGCIAIAEALHLNTRLESIDLSHCLIDFDGGEAVVDRGAKAIANALQTNKTLISLHISFNGIGLEGITAIASALQHNTTLNTLVLYHCNLSISEETKIIELLEANTSLTTIQFFYHASPLQERINNLVTRNRCIDLLTTAAITEDILEIVPALSYALKHFPLIDSISTLHPLLVDAYNHCCNNLCLLLTKKCCKQLPPTDPILELFNSYPQIRLTLTNILFTHVPDENDAARYKSILYLLRFDLDNPAYKWIINTCLAKLQNRTETISQIEHRHSLLTGNVTPSKDGPTNTVSKEFLISFDTLKQAALTIIRKYQAHTDALSYKHRIIYFSFLCSRPYSLDTAVKLLNWSDIRTALNIGESPVVMLEEFIINPIELKFIVHDPIPTDNPELLAHTLFISCNNSNRLVELCAQETYRFFNKDSSQANLLLSDADPTDATTLLVNQLIRFKEIYDNLYILKPTYAINIRARDKTAYDSVTNTSKATTYNGALTHHHLAFIRNLIPNSGSEQYRTEEAILSRLRKAIPTPASVECRKQDAPSITCMDVLKGTYCDMALIDRVSGMGNITQPEGTRRDPHEQTISTLIRYLGLDDLDKQATILDFDALQFDTIRDIKCIIHSLIYATIKYLFFINVDTTSSCPLLGQLFKLYPSITNDLQKDKFRDRDMDILNTLKGNISLIMPYHQATINRCMQRLINYRAKFAIDANTEMLYSLLEKLKSELERFKTNFESFNQQIDEELAVYAQRPTLTP